MGGKGQLLVHPGGVVHDAGGRARLEQFAAHELHVRGDVAEDVLIAGAQVVQAWFAVGRGHEAMFGTFAVAEETDVAVEALFG